MKKENGLLPSTLSLPTLSSLWSENPTRKRHLYDFTGYRAWRGVSSAGVFGYSVKECSSSLTTILRLYREAKLSQGKDHDWVRYFLTPLHYVLIDFNSAAPSHACCRPATPSLYFTNYYFVGYLLVKVLTIHRVYCLSGQRMSSHCITVFKCQRTVIFIH